MIDREIDRAIDRATETLRTRTWTGKDADRDAILEALGALARIGAAASHAATDVLAHATSGHSGIRLVVAKALCAMMPEVVARGLADALAVPARRGHAVSVIAELATDKVLSPMHHDARAAPLTAALRDAPAILEQLLALDGAEALRAAAFLAPADPRVLAALEAAAASPNERLRREVPNAAHHVGDAAVPVLLRLAADAGHADESAVYVLGRMGTPAAVTALRKISRTAKGSVRQLARERIPKPAARKPREK